jgi:hypothetical protein
MTLIFQELGHSCLKFPFILAKGQVWPVNDAKGNYENSFIKDY